MEENGTWTFRESVLGGKGNGEEKGTAVSLDFQNGCWPSDDNGHRYREVLRRKKNMDVVNDEGSPRYPSKACGLSRMWKAGSRVRRMWSMWRAVKGQVVEITIDSAAKVGVGGTRSRNLVASVLERQLR